MQVCKYVSKNVFWKNINVFQYSGQDQGRAIHVYTHTRIHTHFIVCHTDVQTYRHTDIQTYRRTYIHTYIHTYQLSQSTPHFAKVPLTFPKYTLLFVSTRYFRQSTTYFSKAPPM